MRRAGFDRRNFFVRHHVDAWPQQPVAGELWEFEGDDRTGDFSPIIRATNGICLGNTVLPPPIHPTREQLVNGSMDAEWVEIRGVVVDVSATEMTLLTRDGKVKILEKTIICCRPPPRCQWPVRRCPAAWCGWGVFAAFGMPPRGN